jgi:hypothetical protein
LCLSSLAKKLVARYKPLVDDAAADAGSFEGCPEAAVAADFQKSYTVFALAAAGADFGITLVRAPVDEAVKVGLYKLNPVDL